MTVPLKVTVRDFKAKISEYISRIKKGESFAVNGAIVMDLNSIGGSISISPVPKYVPTIVSAGSIPFPEYVTPAVSISPGTFSEFKGSNFKK